MTICLGCSSSKVKILIIHFIGQTWESSLRNYSSPITNASPAKRTLSKMNSGQPQSSQHNLNNKSRKNNTKDEDDKTHSATDEADLASKLKGSIVKAEMGIGFDDVTGLEKAKQCLREAIILPALRYSAFQKY